MNDIQEAKFDEYGCACRCLIVLARHNGHNITKAEFIERFSKHPQLHFWNRKQAWGLTEAGYILDILRELRIGSSFQVFISKERVRKEIRRQSISGVLLCTEKREKLDGSLEEYFHCSLVASKLGPNEEFGVIQVNPNFQCQSAWWTDEQIDRLDGYFLLIRPYEEN